MPVEHNPAAFWPRRRNSGGVALTNDGAIATLTHAFANDGGLLHEWSANIAKISRPAASLEIAKFLLKL